MELKLVIYTIDNLIGMFYLYLYGIETVVELGAKVAVAKFYLYLYGIETQQHYELEEKLDVLLVPLWN